MPDNFTWTEEEKAAATGAEQLAMFNRLVDFVNARLTEIQKLQGDMTDVKSEVDNLKTDTPNT